jgi:hypothetical protein
VRGWPPKSRHRMTIKLAKQNKVKQTLPTGQGGALVPFTAVRHWLYNCIDLGETRRLEFVSELDVTAIICGSVLLC